MNHEGPSLEALLRRVAETPADFLAETQARGALDGVHVTAVVADLGVAYGDDGPPRDYTPTNTATDKRRASLVLLLAWLLAEPELIAASPAAERLHTLLADGAAELAAQLTAARYVSDPERREELVRYALARLDLRPRGESIAHAQDRLAALNSAERARVVAASRQAELRARQIREALARKAAQESADKYTRE